MDLYLPGDIREGLFYVLPGWASLTLKKMVIKKPALISMKASGF